MLRKKYVTIDEKDITTVFLGKQCYHKHFLFYFYKMQD